jgi:hypothetical protein
VTSSGGQDDHCLLMSRRDVLFDPARPFPAVGDELVTVADPADIDYAILMH